MSSYRKCSISGCDDQKSPRHRFPDPVKYAERFKKWILLCEDQQLLSKDPNLIYRSNRVCHRHFKIEDRATNMFIQKNAIPSLFLPTTRAPRAESNESTIIEENPQEMDTDSIPDDLNRLSKEELIAKIKALQAHNLQLRNIIKKKENPTEKTISENTKQFDFTKCKFRRVLLKFFYLGWDYQGYVVQEDTTKTIEHELFKALYKTRLIEDRKKSNYHRCGRTDKGVSAFAQTISINLRSQSDDLNKELNYCKILNRVLPSTIQCIAWYPLDSNDNEFSARFNCNSRTYKYYFPKANLDIEKIEKAAQLLCGLHDFRNFCKMDVNNGVVEYQRSINSIEIEEFSSNKDIFTIYCIKINAKAFLWHQIRCIMGVLLLIGQNLEEPEIINDLFDIEKNPRRPDYFMANEIPLILYDTEFDKIEWIYDKEAVSLAMRALWDHWTFTKIKSTMLEDMLKDLQEATKLSDFVDINNLISGVKTKNYIPVMKRKLCDSLEDKIKRYKKRVQL